MRYVKKTCILRQLKNGFSADGKSLSGIIKAEQYGNNLAIEISTVNLASTSVGEYCYLLADKEKRYKILSTGESNRFSFHSDMEIAGGFYAVLCFVSGNATPIAYAACGNLSYDVFSLVRQVFSEPQPKQILVLNKDLPPTNLSKEPIYNDDLVASDNYFEKENNDHAENNVTQNCDYAQAESGDTNQSQTERTNLDENENDKSVRHAFGTESDGYYQSIRSELNSMFDRYPKDDTLANAYPASEWIRVKGAAEAPEELIGLIYEHGRVKYICYAVPATPDAPNEVKEKAYFVPCSPLTPEVGFYVLYQSAATGENIPKKQS